MLKTSVALGSYTPILSNGSAIRDPFLLVLRVASTLDAFRSYQRGAWLPGNAIHNRYTSGAGSPFLSYSRILALRRKTLPEDITVLSRDVLNPAHVGL